MKTPINSRRIGRAPLAGWAAVFLACVAWPHSAKAQDGNSSARQASPRQEALRPRKLEAQWRSLSAAEPVQSVTLKWDGQKLHYQLTRPPGAKSQFGDRKTVTPSAAAWDEFWSGVSREDLWKWQPNYQGQPVPTARRTREPRAWSVMIEQGTNRVHSAGTNAYPNMTNVLVVAEADVMFHRFWDAADRLVAQPVEVDGRYFAGFEASILFPSSPGFEQQRWWLEGTPEFFAQYQKLSPKDEAGLRFAGPEVTARVRGRLAGPGRYGHLSGYEYMLLVEKVLDMKPAKPR